MLTAEWRAVESLPASLHDVREPANSRSNTRTSRAPACVETGAKQAVTITCFPAVQVDDHLLAFLAGHE